MARRALIFGVGGQDGAYLARLLLGKGYEVSGTSRSASGTAQPNLERLGMAADISLLSLDPADRAAVETALAAVRPDEIYYLSAQSSVFRSFEDPVGTIGGIVVGLSNVLDAARRAHPIARIFNAASGDCFGETTADAPAREDTPFAPRSPYAAAKCGAHHQLTALRLAYSQFACSGFLFNHESALRPETFAFGKIASVARRIAAGSDEKLRLGNVEVVRDWGWAPEYAEAMWRMLQQDEPRDLIIATGRSNRLADFVSACFAAVGLDWQDHVEIDPAQYRPSDIAVHHADPSAAREAIGWGGRTGLQEIARRMVRGDAVP